MSETWAIVLIDDEEDIRDVMSLALADAGYDVRTAPDGEAGLRMCTAAPPQIVITDIRMPGMNGLQVLERIKQQFPDTEVIVATAFGEMELAIRALQLDASDFITKPIGSDNLFLALHRARERYTSRRRLKDYTLLLEREKAETSQQLLKTIAFQRNMIESSMDGILAVDEQQIVVIYNRSMERLIGIPRDQVLHRMPFSRFFRPEEALRFESGLRGEQFGGRNRLFLFETLLSAESGREIPVQVSAAVLTDNGLESGLAAAVAGRLGETGVLFVTDLDPNSGEFEVDATYVQAALLNILENAVDACLASEARRPPKVVFSLQRRRDRVEFDILDNGVGMDAGTQEKLFTPFFSSKGNKGTGLGLFVANKVVEQHGGEITVSSAPGRGSLFRISLPAASRGAPLVTEGGKPGTEHPCPVETPAAEKTLS